MKKNLFIARTPLQLFNCMEAKNRFHAKEENILFYQYQRDIDKKQMESLLNINEWSEVVPYPLNWKRRLFFTLFLYNLKQKYQRKINTCYYGAYNSIIASVINFIQPKKLIIVDDGTKTLEISRLLKEGSISKRNSLKRFRDKIFSSNIEFIYRSSFFSIYTIEELNIENEVIKNEYRSFKTYVKSMPKKEVVYFIGTNLNEKILKDKESFETYIKKLKTYYANKKLIYILHRYEDIEFIASLAQKYHFDYVKFDSIIEIEIVKAGFIPIEFSTFGSSAIETLPLLYSESKYKIFYIESEDIKENKQKAFKKLYEAFKEKRYEVLHLK